MNQASVSMSKALESSPAQPAGGRSWLAWVVIIAGSAAAVVAAYLTWQSLVAGALPVGCGEGSGCGEVLTSRFARLWGLPVSLPALLAYGLLVGLVAGSGRKPSPLRWYLVVALASAILVSVGWFVYLQLVVLKAICPWCMIDHGLGAVAALAGIALAFNPRRTGSHWPILNGLATGIALAAALAVSQWVAGGRVMILEGVEVSLLDDRFNLDVALEPHVGSPTAEHQLFMLFDYACPHCKSAHERIKRLQARRDDLVVVFLPASIEPRCNPAFDTVADRFIGSCDLAELALAVHLIDPAQFAAFDQWLYEWDGFTPRTVDAARARAEALVGADRLANMLANGLPRQALDRNVRILTATTAGHVPVMIVPGKPPIVGRVDDDAPIEAMLTDPPDSAE